MSISNRYGNFAVGVVWVVNEFFLDERKNCMNLFFSVGGLMGWVLFKSGKKRNSKRIVNYFLLCW